MNKFRNQGALTVIAKIKPGETQSLRDLLAQMVPPNAHVESNNIIPFAELTTIHFARFVVVDESLSVDSTLRPVEPFIVFSSNYDDPLDKHLEQLVDVAGDGLDKIYSHCRGYPDLNGITRDARMEYLRKHMKRYAAFHTGTVGLSVERIRMEARLRDEIENFIDDQGLKRGWSSQEPRSIREDIRRHIGQTDLSWALTPPDDPPRSYRVFRGSGLWTVIKLIISVMLVPVLLALVFALTVLPNLSLLFKLLLVATVFVALFGIWLIILSYKEKSDRIFPRTRYDDRAKKLMARENKVVQNQMTNLVDMKPGLFRLLTDKFFLSVVEILARYYFTKGKLADIPTIHFARWVYVDNNRGLLFFSNYGSSWESYLGDFVDKAAVGLTGVWSSTVLYPRTRFLVFDGATDEERFKVWARAQQLRTDVWYTAYKTLTVKNILNNKAIRQGLSGDLTEEQTLEWLSRF